MESELRILSGHRLPDAFHDARGIVAAGADDQVQGRDQTLRVRHEVARPGRFAQRGLLDVRHYADDLAPRRFFFGGGQPRVDSPADRMLTRAAPMPEAVRANGP